MGRSKNKSRSKKNTSNGEGGASASSSASGGGGGGGAGSTGSGNSQSAGVSVTGDTTTVTLKIAECECAGEENPCFFAYNQSEVKECNCACSKRQVNPPLMRLPIMGDDLDGIMDARKLTELLAGKHLYCFFSDCRDQPQEIGDLKALNQYLSVMVETFGNITLDQSKSWNGTSTIADIKVYNIYVCAEF
jgi:hypothetical protein